MNQMAAAAAERESHPEGMIMAPNFDLFGAQKIAPSEGETFNFNILTPSMEAQNHCMWSAGRLGDMALRETRAVTLDGANFAICVIHLPGTRSVDNPRQPGRTCLWPVLFRGQLARRERTPDDIREHLSRNMMGNVASTDGVSWFATDPATATVYGYPDAYTVQQERPLALLDAGHPGTVDFVQQYYKKYHKSFEQRTGPLMAGAATTAFILDAQKTSVQRNTEWTADNHVAKLLAHSDAMIKDLQLDGWALDWTSMMHTEIMLVNAYPKLALLGSVTGTWSARDVSSISKKFTDLTVQTNKQQRKVRRARGSGFATSGIQLASMFDDATSSSEESQPIMMSSEEFRPWPTTAATATAAAAAEMQSNTFATPPRRGRARAPSTDDD